MPDRTIPLYNMFLRCSCYRCGKFVLPEDYSIISYRQGYDKAMAELKKIVPKERFALLQGSSEN